VNRKDITGNNIFQGGFLGLDNIGVFDRSAELPTGGFMEQSDGTSWMGMYCLNLLEIAMELGRHNPSYEDVASKFFEHFMYIAHAMNTLGLWDEDDGFFYDVLRLPNGRVEPLKVRSMVGLIPLFAVGTVGEDDLEKLPRFRSRLLWFVGNRPDICESIATMSQLGPGKRRILSILNAERLRRVLKVMLDETEFLSPHGIRALSHYHLNHPYVLAVDGAEHRVQYEPAESSTAIFGGNSNWRGPIWFPLNFLIIESLQKYHYYYGDDFQVEFPTGSGIMLTLWEVARELSKRLASIFLRDESGRRAVYGGTEKFQRDPFWRELILFYEYFHGDNGAGIGASHQTGWTALVAKLLLQIAGHGVV
jgi:Glycosyl hydrolase family 63 C-terminal domain